MSFSESLVLTIYSLTKESMFKNKEGKIRSGWKIAAVTGAFLAAILIVIAIIQIITMPILISNGDFNLKTLEYTENGMRIMNKISLASMFIQEIFMIIIPIIAWKFIMKRKLSHMGLTSLKEGSKDLLMGLLFGIISITVVFILIITTKNGTVESWRPNFSFDTLIYLFLFIMVGFAEEIYGRGFIMSTLRQTKSIPAIIIISSIIFALLHSGNSGISIIPYINLFLVGVLFAYMYLKSANLWMCIGYHITWNYFQGNVFGFKVSGTSNNGILTTYYETDNVFNGGAFGPEGGLFVTVVILLGFIVVNRIYKDKKLDFLSIESGNQEQIPEQQTQTFDEP